VVRPIKTAGHATCLHLASVVAEGDWRTGQDNCSRQMLLSLPFAQPHTGAATTVLKGCKS
jgi:hypothetical protein